MEYKLFGGTILDTEDINSVGAFLVFLGIVGMVLFIIFGLFCLHWIPGCIGICVGLIALGMFLANL